MPFRSLAPFARVSILRLSAFWMASLLFASQALVQRVSAQTVRPNTYPYDLVNEARYKVTVNGVPLPVLYVGQHVYAVSFDFTGGAQMAVHVEESDLIQENLYFWKAIREAPKHESDYFKGHAIVRPLSKNIKTETEKNSTSFKLDAPGQYTLEAPGVHSYDDEVLLIFANPPETNIPKPTDPNVIYLAKGMHFDHITLKSDQTLYLEEGAVLVGAVNVWDAKNVRIRGRGMVLFQDPLRFGHDNGPYNIPNQHSLTTHNVQGLSIEGVTFVVRSQTWSIQLVHTWDVVFRNVKIINVTLANIGGDGIDWMDSGRGKVVNSFIRSADDNIALLSANALTDFRPVDPTKVEHFGELKDITVEHCVFWNTFGSILRMGWTSQSLTTSDIVFRDMDIIHGQSLMVIGIPKRVGHAHHSNYLFENLRFEEPATLGNWSGDTTAKYTNFVFSSITVPRRTDGVDGIVQGNPEIRYKNIVKINPAE